MKREVTASPVGLTRLPTVTFVTHMVTSCVPTETSTSLPEMASTTRARLTAAPVIVAPQPPTAVTGVAGDAKATVSWTAPADDGGSPVLDYTAMASPGGKTCSANGTSCEVSGLTNGTGYRFTVTARNAKGVSAPSAPSHR